MVYLATLLGVLISTCTQVQASGVRISSELAVVKGCARMTADPSFNYSMDRVYEASVQDLGRRLQVTMKWQENEDYDCIGWEWFKYDGSVAACEDCDGADSDGPCFCVSARCYLIPRSTSGRVQVKERKSDVSQKKGSSFLSFTHENP
jgi:hypothetical protein